MNRKTYITTIQEADNGGLYIDLPDEMLDELGWDIHDDLIWVIEDDGAIILRKNTDDSSNEA